MRANESHANEIWFRDLRDRFVSVAARRVERDAVEDLVQDALRIVHEKAAVGPGTLVDGKPALAWCFQVLRNVIGNHYQRRRSAAATLDDQALTADDPTPLDRLEAADRVREVQAALAELERGSRSCGRYLRGVLGGVDPGDLATGDGIEPAVLYRRLYRCREQLRQILAARGVRS